MEDKRLRARLAHGAELLAEYPGRAVSAAVEGHYRLIDQPAELEETPERILAPHRTRNVARMHGQETVLCIQDGRDLKFATRMGDEGLEVIRRNETGTGTLGLHLHLTLAVTVKGLPLGVLRCEFGTPKKARGRKTHRWLKGYADIAEATGELPRQIRVIAVMDPEADCFELFDAQRRHGRVELLVRARHDRNLEGEGRKLFAALAEGPAAGCMEVEIAHRKRLAVCELRFRRLTLPPTRGDAASITVHGVHLVEREPPDGEETVEWHLLTTVPVAVTADAAEVVSHYLQRRRLEDFFRVFKAGCRVEHLRLWTTDRLPQSLAINSVIAWRLTVMALLGRQEPGCAVELLFADDELGFLGDYARYFGLRGPEHSGAALRLVAHLGGYRGRKHDPGPGNQIMWHGYRTLIIATLGHQIGVRAALQQAP